MSKTKELSANGSFKRQSNRFNDTYEEGNLRVEKDRYRLIWTAACPWATRVVIAREILGLENYISLGEVDPLRPKVDRVDWAFTLDENNEDPILKSKYLSEIYFSTDYEYSGRPTVPILVDTKRGKIVSNDYNYLTLYLNSLEKIS